MANVSRWERQLEKEADDTREQLEKRFLREGDSNFTNVANIFIGWRLFLATCAIIAASAAAISLIIYLLIAILKSHD